MEWIRPGMRPVPLGGAAGGDDHQDDVLARVREAWARSTALPFATAASLRDIDAAEFSTHILPALEQLDGLRLEPSGARPAYRELPGDPALTATQVESPDPDSCDLGVIDQQSHV